MLKPPLKTWLLAADALRSDDPDLEAAAAAAAPASPTLAIQRPLPSVSFQNWPVLRSDAVPLACVVRMPADEKTHLTAASSTTQGGLQEPGKYERYYVLTLLVWLNVLNYCDRALLTSFANFIMPDLALTATQLGILTGFGFTTIYAFMGIISGSIADAVHRPRLIAVGMCLWSVLTAVSGFAQGFIGLLLPRVFVGIGESVLAPSALSLIADYFPPSHLAMATGFFGSAVHLGVGLSLLLAGLLGENVGWRPVFFSLGAVGVCLALSVPLVVRELRIAERSRGVSADRFRSGVASLCDNLALAASLYARVPSLSLVTAGAVGLGWAGAAQSFLQPWMVQERGFTRTEAALSAGLVVLTVGAAANPLNGILADRAYRRTGLPKVSFAALGLVCVQLPAAICFLLGTEARSVLFWASLAAWLLGGAVYGPVVSALQELSPPPLQGTMLGLGILVINLFGAGLGNLVFGVLVDMLTAAGAVHPLTTTMVGFVLVSTCMQAACFLAAGWRFEKDVKQVRKLIQEAQNASAVRTDAASFIAEWEASRASRVEASA